MNKLIYLFFCAVLIGFLPFSSANALPALMPMPTNVTLLEGNSQLNSTLTVYVAKEQQAALAPLLANSQLSTQFSAIQWTAFERAQLQLKVNKLDGPLPYLAMDESYALSIENQVITLSSANQYGLLRGLATLSQLVFLAEKPRQLVNVTITDSPTYPWRGLLFDGVRHFLPIDDVKRTLRGLASAKFNVFHWHLTDDQGWRIELNSYPKLHQTASDGLYYTQAQIKEVVAYAAQLGIRVVPEFDVPGHASAIILAYPELGSGTVLSEMERHWGVFKPLLDPSNPKVYLFVDEVVDELAGLFPDPYLHIGGDEVDDSDWQTNSQIQAYMQTNNLSDSYALHAYFNQRVATILAKYHKKMIGWDEVLHPSLPKNTLVQSWRGHHSLTAIREAGFDGLLSSGFYIDQPQWTSYHYRNHPVPAPTKKVVAHKLKGSVNFTLTRLKGSPVTGQVDVFTNHHNAIFARVEIKGKGQFISHNVKQTAGVYQITLDTWMGPTTLRFALGQNSQLDALIGNTPYTFAAQANTTSLEHLNTLLIAEQQREQTGNVLGGEATIWSELITTENLDTRLWPRLYAIAERFWSSPSLTNERDMYQRLAVMHRYANEHVGLLQQQQFVQRLKHVAGATVENIDALITFSQLIEPAHYYTLHHLAYLRDEYHQLAPLDKIVDALPVESLALRRFDDEVADYQLQCAAAKLSALQAQLQAWQSELEKNHPLFMTIDEWQASYIAILQALKQYNDWTVEGAVKKGVAKNGVENSVKNHNGTITQVIASINNLKRAQQMCL
ncbi:family 20 glycosylhydrolase [Pseudoalteromonas tunicata]|uniref:N-acetyl-beta-glucosaminidase n=1 Tax=Pseudoalteromonas tunicata D2 TaxID=87626 RepID=A4CAC6_9GAMM|nr:family 20 glycosylhydrolase [Pseudoalteromonas tunicata]ATC94883.1 hexosaminidase [Pseudoalteromonas tunicata]AXT30562.1 hypothetical protein D1819_06815 [Pseudoalteromonas tunicata]EAR28334.1 hypothetical protein PTD2_21002 [Pseudoalteromonas tunicata D2]